jgi:oligopeptide transport system substrate-binding protein
MTKRFRMIVAAIAVFALVLAMVAGCAPTKPSGQAAKPTTEVKKGGSMSFYVGEPAYIDPYNTQESEGTQVEQAVFDSLTEFDPLDPTKVVPAAAKSWSANADASVWTFKLRADGKFSDGTPVKAQDFIYGWNRIANPNTLNTSTKKVEASSIGYHLGPIKGYDEMQAKGSKVTEMSGLKAIDDYTLEVTLKAPFGDFEYVVGHPALAPVEKALVEGGVDFNGTKVAFGDMPVGNGPFKLSEPWKRGQYIKVVRNDAYPGTKPLIDGIDFRIFQDPNTAYTEFEAGTLDFTQIGEGKIKDAVARYGEAPGGYTANPGKQALLGSENSIYYLDVNNQDFPALKDYKFRKALSLGINRQAICDVVFQGTRLPADNIVPPGIAGYAPGLWPDSKYDAAAAVTALADAGFPGGKGAPEISLWYNADGGHQKIMELIKADLDKMGLKVKLSPTPDFATYLKQLGAGKVQIGRLGWSADYPIIYNFLYPLFDSKSTDNYSKFKDPAVDAAIQAAEKRPDAAARIAAFTEVDKTIGAQLPVIPIMFYRHHHVASARVHALTYSAMNLADFTKVWVDAKK